MACNPLWVLCVTALKFCISEHLTLLSRWTVQLCFYVCLCIHSGQWYGDKMCNGSFSLGSLSAAVLEEEGESPCVCTWDLCNILSALATSLAPDSFLEGNMQWFRGCLIHPHRDYQFAHSMSGRRSGVPPFRMVGDAPLAMSQGVLGNHLLDSEVPDFPGRNRGELRYFIRVSQEKKAAGKNP